MLKVSICLVTYNRAEVLSATIDSILRQSYKNFELIISDDHSSDGTKEICEDYQRKDARVKYYCNAQNLRMPGNLNAAIARATGEYIADLHDGDVYNPELIAKWVKALDTYPEALFVFNGYEIIDQSGSGENLIHPDFQDINEGSLLMEYFLKTFSSAPWGTVMVRRSAFEKFGLFDPKYGFISDVDMWLRLGYRGKVAYINEPLITLAPKDPGRFYYYPDWDIIRSNFNILKVYYKLFTCPKPTPNEINRRILVSMVRNLLILIKHKQWNRVREGLEIFTAGPFFLFRAISRILVFRNRKLSREKISDFWSDILIR